MSTFDVSGSSKFTPERVASPVAAVPRSFRGVFQPHQVRRSVLAGFGAEVLLCRDIQEQFLMSDYSEGFALSSFPNKSLERTTAESAFFHSQLLGGRRSALRWAPLKAKDRVFQMSDFERRDSSIRGSSIPVAVGQCGPECGLVIPESTFGA